MLDTISWGVACRPAWLIVPEGNLLPPVFAGAGAAKSALCSVASSTGEDWRSGIGVGAQAIAIAEDVMI
jgi:hypothetical protein